MGLSDEQLSEFVASLEAGVDEGGLLAVASPPENEPDGGPTGDEVTWLRWAVGYMVSPDEAGPYFGPVISGPGGEYPPPLDSIDEVALQLWERTLGLIADGLVQGRLADLLWERKFGDRPDRWADIAIRDHLAAVNGQERLGWPMQVELAERALDLAKRAGRDENEPSVADAFRSIWRRSLVSEAGAPLTPAYPALARLATMTAFVPISELLSLVAEARELLAGIPYAAERLIVIEMGIAEPDRLKELQLEHVEVYAAQARSSTGFQAMTFYSAAEELAARYQLSDLGGDLAVERAKRTDSLEGASVAASEFSVSVEQWDSWVEGLVGEDNASNALARVGLWPVLASRPERERQAKQAMRAHPLLYLTTKVIRGDFNSEIRRVDTEEGHLQQLLTEHATIHITAVGEVVRAALAATIEKYDGIEGFVEHLAPPVFDESMKAPVRTALRLYQSGDYDTAAALLAPRLERAIRNMAHAIGAPVTRSAAAGGRDGGVVPLGTLLRDLDGHVDPSLLDHLRVLLVEPTGINLRNRIAHGLVDEVGEREAAMLIQAVAALALLRLSGEEPETDKSASDGMIAAPPETQE